MNYESVKYIDPYVGLVNTTSPYDYLEQQLCIETKVLDPKWKYCQYVCGRTPPPSNIPDKLSATAVLVFGGTDPKASKEDKRVGASIYCYRPHQNTWSLFGVMPERRNYMAGVYTRGYVFLTGGNKPDEGVCRNQTTNTTFRMDVGSKRWQTMSGMIFTRAFHSMAAIDDAVFAFGGRNRDGSVVFTAEKYNPEADQWTIIRPLPEPRMGMACTVCDDLVWLIGGFTYPPNDRGGGLPMTNSVICYNPVKNTYFRKANLKNPLAFSAAASVCREVWVFGGLTCPPSDRTYLYSVPWVDVCEPATRRWERRLELPLPKHCLGAVRIAHKMFLFGGMSSNTGNLVPDTDVYDRTNEKLYSLAECPATVVGAAYVVIPIEDESGRRLKTFMTEDKGDGAAKATKVESVLVGVKSWFGGFPGFGSSRSEEMAEERVEDEFPLPTSTSEEQSIPKTKLTSLELTGLKSKLDESIGIDEMSSSGVITDQSSEEGEKDRELPRPMSRFESIKSIVKSFLGMGTSKKSVSKKKPSEKSEVESKFGSVSDIEKGGGKEDVDEEERSWRYETARSFVSVGERDRSVRQESRTLSAKAWSSAQKDIEDEDVVRQQSSLRISSMVKEERSLGEEPRMLSTKVIRDEDEMEEVSIDRSESFGRSRTEEDAIEKQSSRKIGSMVKSESSLREEPLKQSSKVSQKDEDEIEEVGLSDDGSEGFGRSMTQEDEEEEDDAIEKQSSRKISSMVKSESSLREEPLRQSSKVSQKDEDEMEEVGLSDDGSEGFGRSTMQEDEEEDVVGKQSSRKISSMVKRDSSLRRESQKLSSKVSQKDEDEKEAGDEELYASIGDNGSVSSLRLRSMSGSRKELSFKTPSEKADVNSEESDEDEVFENDDSEDDDE